MSANVESVGDAKRASRASLPAKRRSYSLSLWRYVHSELTRSYELENEEAEYRMRRNKVYGFITVPVEMEKFVCHGFVHCLDSFLFVLTFLPIRITLALVSIVCRFIFAIFRGFVVGGLVRPAELIDLLKGFVLATCLFCFSFVDTSVVYHSIKSQSTVKLYIMYNMIEVVDRLLSAFGRDTLDALLWTATEPNNNDAGNQKQKRGNKWRWMGLLTVHLLMTMVYVFGHTLVVLMQASTLNVAFNASSNTLLTIMMSNNFVELKGSVFKKFDRKLLFQVACSDVRERFHLFVLLFVVVVQTMKEYGWKEESFWQMAPWCVVVLLVELLIDWCKHAFIARFNEISADEYKDYTFSLAYDLLQMKSQNTSSDHSDLVARRMGFIPLPLVVVILRVVGSALTIQSYEALCVCLLAFVCLLTFRVLVSIIIMGKACKLMDQRQQSKVTTPIRSGNAKQSPQVSRRGRLTPTPTSSSSFKPPFASSSAKISATVHESSSSSSIRKTLGSPKSSPNPSKSNLTLSLPKSSLSSPPRPSELRQRSSASCCEPSEKKRIVFETLTRVIASDAASLLPDVVNPLETSECSATRSKTPSGEESSSGIELESLLANMSPLKLRSLSTPDFMDEFLKSNGDQEDNEEEELTPMIRNGHKKND